MIPAIPAQPDGPRASGPVPLRYEDVDQDGRLRLVGIPHALGALCWPAVMALPESRQSAAAGVIPILSRMILQVGQGPVSAMLPLEGHGVVHRDAISGPDGQPERLLLMMWVDLYARAGWTLSAPDPGAPRILAGRIYAEHVFTRLFAGPGQRRVRELPGFSPRGGWPERRYDELLPPDPTCPTGHGEHSFGLTHTDPNGHVNSLVYPRIFEEDAILLRGEPAAARTMEVIWRKPFFAGERASLTQWRSAKDQVHGDFLDASGTSRARMHMGWSEPDAPTKEPNA